MPPAILLAFQLADDTLAASRFSMAITLSFFFAAIISPPAPLHYDISRLFRC
jgi:hypothetical protein